jgi:cell division protein FtsB
MNLCNAQAASGRGDNNNSGGGGTLRGAFDAAPANPLAVGAVGFGPGWNAEDSMAASIVRLECEADELRAEVAMLQQQARIITQERDEARIQYRSTEALGMALVKTIGEMKSERVDLKAKIEALRDQLCADKCRDKSQADGGWANI